MVPPWQYHRRRNGRQRGSIEELPSGALRVAVYAGRDPLTGRWHYLREVIRPGPVPVPEAQKALRWLANQVDERRNPRTNATINQLLDRYPDQFDGAPRTLELYRGYVCKPVPADRRAATARHSRRRPRRRRTLTVSERNRSCASYGCLCRF